MYLTFHNEESGMKTRLTAVTANGGRLVIDLPYSQKDVLTAIKQAETKEEPVEIETGYGVAVLDPMDFVGGYTLVDIEKYSKLKEKEIKVEPAVDDDIVEPIPSYGENLDRLEKAIAVLEELATQPVDESQPVEETTQPEGDFLETLQEWADSYKALMAAENENKVAEMVQQFCNWVYQSCGHSVGDTAVQEQEIVVAQAQ